jgi:signal transduction histidine kinase
VTPLSHLRQGAGDAELTANEPDRLYQQFLFIHGTALAIGLHVALLALSVFRSVEEALFIVTASMVYGTLTFALWVWVLPRFSAFPTWRRIFAQLAVAMACFTVLSLVSVELRAMLFGGSSILMPYTGGPRTVTIPAEAIRRAPLIYALIPILPTALLAVVGFNMHFWQIFELKGRQEALRELAVSAQLAALRTQVNPHFLFNSLNSIAQLISTDPVKAEACVERLGEIYRYLLHRAQADFVSLSDELSFAEAYLEIERARFGENLVVEECIDERTRPLLLPSLILQPLVENAVKHGISPKLGGGRVTIEAILENGDLRLAVRDTGVGVKSQGSLFEAGVGLRNVRERLLRLYGSEYAPHVSSQPGEGTTVTLRIPVALGSA